MTLAMLLAAADVLVLKDKVEASGRFVTLLEVVREDKLGFEARESIKGIYLGRAPETGERTITSEEITRELRRRGLEGWRVEGEKVVVTPSGAEPRMGEWNREALAFEIKCLLVTTRRMKAADFAVRIAYLEPESLPEGFQVAGVRPRDESDLQRAEYSIVLENTEKKRRTAVAIARVLPIREVAFATRDLLPQRTVAREDFEIRRVEIEREERFVGEVDSLVGARVLVKIRKGAALTRIDLKLKPAVKRGETVRARHPYVEADARVVEEGAVGEVIWLEWVGTGARFRGRVISSREVHVVEEERR